MPVLIHSSIHSSIHSRTLFLERPQWALRDERACFQHPDGQCSTAALAWLSSPCTDVFRQQCRPLQEQAVGPSSLLCARTALSPSLCSLSPSERSIPFTSAPFTILPFHKAVRWVVLKGTAWLKFLLRLRRTPPFKKGNQRELLPIECHFKASFAGCSYIACTFLKHYFCFYCTGKFLNDFSS